MSAARHVAALALIGSCTLVPSWGRAAPGSITRSQSIEIKDLHYFARTYFFIHDRPAQFLGVEVWRNDRLHDDYPSPEIPAWALLNPDSAAGPTNPQGVGYWHRLEQGRDYGLISPWLLDGAPEGFEILVLRLERPLGNEEALAVVYRYVDEPGTFPKTKGSHDPPRFKAIKVPLESMAVDEDTGIFHPQGIWYPTLRNELRNVYYLGSRNLPYGRLRIKVRREAPGAIAGPDHDELAVPYIQTLGLDQRDADGNSTPDGFVDPEFLDLPRGVLFFPDLHPFDPDTLQGSMCQAGFGGFLCLDNLLRNTLRVDSQYESREANPFVYYKRFPDPVADSHYYLEVELLPAPPPGAVLHQNAPNPFNPETVIQFDLNTPERVKVTILDVQGRVVTRLLDSVMPEGPNQIRWSGTDGSGRRVSSGVFFCRLETPSTSATRKMVLAR